MKRFLSYLLLVMLVCGILPLTAIAEEAARVPLTIIAADGGRVNMPDNPIIEEIGKRTGTKIDLQLITAADFKTKLNTLVSSGMTPDIVRLGGSDHFDYVEQDVFLPLDDLLEEYAPNIMAYMPERAWDVTMVDGVKYGVPGYNWAGKYVHVLREDWLDNLGLEAPTTLDELKEVYRAFTEDDPDGNGVADTYGISTDGEITTGHPNAFMPVFGAYGVMPANYSLEGDKVINNALTQGYREAIAFISEVYQAGYVDPDFFIVKEDQARQNLAAGRSGSFTAWWSIPTIVLMEQMNMLEISPSAAWTYANIVGPHGDYGMQASGTASSIACISVDCEYPVEAIKLLDYLVSDEGAYLAAFGIEGEHYEADDNGIFLKRTEAGDEAYNAKWLDAMHQLVVRTDITMMGYERNNAAAWRDIVQARDAKLYYNLMEGISVPEANMYGSDLQSTTLFWFTKFVTGEASLDEYDAYVEEYLNRGGREVGEALVAAYNERNGTNYVFETDY